MIVVTGASGHLGRAVVEQLVKQIDPRRVGVSVRDVDKVADFAALGVRVRQGDFSDPASLVQAFEGATQVLLVSSNARASGGDALAQHRAAIDAATAAGVRRVLYTSHMAASATSAFPPMLDHIATEAMLASSGLAWTALRNGFYASSALMMLGDAHNTGVLAIPEEGVVNFTTHNDLAVAAVAILLDEGRFEGPTPPLVGREQLTLAMVAALVSAKITASTVSDEHQRDKMLARGMPPHVAAIGLGYFIASRRGEFASSDDTLAQLIGRAPQRMQDLLTAA